MKKKVFISYSRKDALDIAEFRSITKYRDFEIVIDDEEITFNQPWKENIVNKINQSDAAILFISKNALNPESPIRSLEIPLIAKRSRDKEDNFNFFPIFLEEIGKELDEYSFTTIREGKEVNFLEIFQVLDIEKQNTLSNQSRRKRNRFFRNINANISHVLKGGTLSPGQNLITQLSRKQKLRWALASILIVFGLGWFTTTDAYARVLIAAYEQRIADGTVSEDSVAVRFLADQLNSVENLDELTTDEVLKESITEIADLNINLDVNTDLQNIDLSSSLESTSTTIGSTSTTIGSTSTTIGSTTTTIVDTIAPTFTKALTATNITAGEVDLSWRASDNVEISYYVLREGSFVIYEGSNTSKEVEGLISSKNYTFSVDAYDSAGNFSTSNVSFVTLSSTTTTSTTTTSTTTTSTTTTSTTIVDNIGPVISGFSVAEEIGSWNAKLVWNASDESGILKYSMNCSKSPNKQGSQSFTQEIGSGSRNYFYINSGQNDPWDTSGDEYDLWQSDHDFDATCTLTAYDNSPNQNSSSSTITWHTAIVPMNNWLDDAQWVSEDQICIRGGNRVGTYLDVDVTVRANGVQTNTYSDVGAAILVTGLSPDTNYTISVTFTDQYGRSETIERDNFSLNTFTTNSRYWSKIYSSFPTSCHLIPTTPTTTTTTTASCVGITFPAPPDNELYIFGTLDVSNCQVLTTGFQCAQNCVGLVNQTADGKTQAYFWAENNSASWLSNWTGYYQPSSGKFYVTSSGQGGGFEFTPPYQGP